MLTPTLGRWELEPLPDTVDGWQIVAVAGYCRTTIARCRRQPNQTIDENLANAMLFAGALELLVAAEEVLANRDPDARLRLCEAVRKARRGQKFCPGPFNQTRARRSPPTESDVTTAAIAHRYEEPTS